MRGRPLSASFLFLHFPPPMALTLLLFSGIRLKEQNATTLCAYIQTPGNCDDVMPYVDFYYCGSGSKAKPGAWVAFVRITDTLARVIKGDWSCIVRQEDRESSEKENESSFETRKKTLFVFLPSMDSCSDTFIGRIDVKLVPERNANNFKRAYNQLSSERRKIAHFGTTWPSISLFSLSDFFFFSSWFQTRSQKNDFFSVRPL